jgi:hypothetical protein
MKISVSQVDVLSRDWDRRLGERIALFLQSQFEDAFSEPEAEVSAVVCELIPKARGYGFSTEREIAVYMTTAWVLGKEFDCSFPKARNILTAQQLSSEQKSEALIDLTEHLLAEFEGDQR